MKRSVLLLYLIAIFIALRICTPTNVFAQFVVNEVFPATHEIHAARESLIFATFTKRLDPNLSTGIVVHQPYAGRVSGSILPGTAVDGTNKNLYFDPIIDLHSGAKVDVTYTTDILRINAEPLDKPFVQQFRTQSSPASAIFTASSSIYSENGNKNVALGDFDNDGFLDIVASATSNETTVFFNDGFGQFSISSSVIISNSSNVSSIATADVDQDGDLDIALGINGSESIIIFNQVPLNTQIIPSSSVATKAVAFGDVDGDGDQDIAIGAFQEQNAIYLNDGSGSFTDGIHYFGSENDSTSSITFSDIDNDGDLDIAVGNQNNETNYVYFNNGSGSFTSGSSQFGMGADDTRSIQFADMDGDGDSDAIVGNYNQQSAVYLNNGNGIFDDGVIPFGTLTIPTTSIELADFDGDGNLDIATGNHRQINVVYLNNDQAEIGNEIRIFGFQSESTEIVISGDIDNDGDMDIVSANENEPSRIHFNQPSEALSLNLRRSFSPNAYCIGKFTTINLHATLSGNAGMLNSLTIIEHIPEPLEPSNISNDGFYISSTREIRWFLLDNFTTPLTYEVTLSSASPECVIFNGTASYLVDLTTEVEQAIEGDSELCNDCSLFCCHPVDGGCGFVIGDCNGEISSYELIFNVDSIWKLGATCPSTEDLLQAADFWKRGGFYVCNAFGEYIPTVPSSFNSFRISYQQNSGVDALEAFRVIPDLWSEDQPNSIQIDLIVEGSPSAIAVEESIPEGFFVTEVNRSGSYISEQNKIRWFLLNNFGGALSYKMIANKPVASSPILHGKVFYSSNSKISSITIEQPELPETRIEQWILTE